MPLIPDDTIAQVIDRNDIVEVVASYIPLKKAGRNFKANCPFHHEKTPSFVVNPDKQIFHCFGCGVGGNVLSFVMKHDHMDFLDAIKILAAKVNVELPKTSQANQKNKNEFQSILDLNKFAMEFYHQKLLCDKSAKVQEAREYLQNRGISLETAKKFRIGYAPDKWDGLLEECKNKSFNVSLCEKAGLIIARENKEGYYDRFRHRIVFPIFDTRGQCRAFGARALEESTAKYINSPETPVYTKGEHLYSLDLVKNNIVSQDQAIVVEGYTDCLVPFQNGIDNMVASLGTALTVEQIRLLRRFSKNVTLLFDADIAGQDAIFRSIDLLVQEGMTIHVTQLDEGEDPDSFVREHGAEAFKERIAKSLSFFDFKLSYLRKRYDQQTAEGKLTISQDMLATIKLFTSPILKAEYLKKLSQAMIINEHVLESEMNKLPETNVVDRTAPERVNKEQKQDESKNPVEWHMLKLLINESRFVSDTRNNVVIEDFKDQQVRAIIGKIFDLYDQGQQIEADQLINEFDDQETKQLISRMAVDETDFDGNKKKMHSDFMARIVGNRAKLQTRDLIRQIQEAESSGNHDRLDLLKKQFNELMKK